MTFLELGLLLANDQLLQLCTASTVISILVTARLYTVIQEVCRWLTNKKQRKTDIRFNRPVTRCFLKPIKVSVIIEQ